MSLPTELVPLILQHLTPRHLLNTCLVSRAWTYHSLVRLYDTVYIHTKHQLKSFLKSLHGLPLTYRLAIRAILVNDGAFYRDYRLGGTCALVFGIQCPRMKVFSCVMPYGTLLSDDPLVTDWAHGRPMPIFIKNMFAVDLSRFPRLCRIGVFPMNEAAPEHEPIYRQLTGLVLTEYQLETLIDEYPDAHLTINAMFPALQTLHLDHYGNDHCLDDIDLAWLQHHCPNLHHLSMKGVTVGDRWIPKPLVHATVRSLVLTSVHIATVECFPLLTTLYPNLKLISLIDMNFQYQRFPHLMLDGLLSWITDCPSLTSFSIIEYESDPHWTMEEVIDGLVDRVNSGSWNCRLNRIEIGASRTHQIFPAKRLLECQPLMQQLDTLFLPLISSHDTTQGEVQMESDHCSSGQPTLYLLCHLAPDTFARLTTLHLNQERGHTHVSLVQLLLMCPTLVTLQLGGIDLHHDACTRHFPAIPPATFNLANLTVTHTDVYRADLFFFLLQHQLPRLSSLAIIGTRIHQLSLAPQESDPFLRLNVALRSLWVIAVDINDHFCFSLCLHENQGSGRMARYTSQPIDDKENDKPPIDFHVACLYADHVLFTHSERTSPL
ncbi:hypothetical protein DM01DRAFT_1331037 [Hesseltinella vesiculosa]|uniref:F-box domain-containing protein n=1 Tax=Hesseltinella vesiculosa TaxID=101127 RepID=A0A1X2GXV0_9FUNG|nr:hypothetical protein DM01DRAFT_1331037 [Hesseltinella vesiculosa]